MEYRTQQYIQFANIYQVVFKRPKNKRGRVCLFIFGFCEIDKFKIKKPQQDKLLLIVNVTRDIQSFTELRYCLTCDKVILRQNGDRQIREFIILYRADDLERLLVFEGALFLEYVSIFMRWQTKVPYCFYFYIFLSLCFFVQVLYFCLIQSLFLTTRDFFLTNKCKIKLHLHIYF